MLIFLLLRLIVVHFKHLSDDIFDGCDAVVLFLFLAGPGLHLLLDVNLVGLDAVWGGCWVEFVFLVNFDLVEHDLLLCFLVLAFLVVLFGCLVGFLFVYLNFLCFFEQFRYVSLIIFFLFIDFLFPVFNEVIELPFLLGIFYRSVSQLLVLILGGMQIHDFKQHLPDDLLVLLLV